MRPGRVRRPLQTRVPRRRRALRRLETEAETLPESLNNEDKAEVDPDVARRMLDFEP